MLFNINVEICEWDHIILKYKDGPQFDMDNQQYGFYDEATQQFYAVPAKTQEEFMQFLEIMGIVRKDQNVKTEQVKENFDDFDMVVEEVARTPAPIFSQQLIQFDL